MTPQVDIKRETKAGIHREEHEEHEKQKEHDGCKYTHPVS
jgi:hypothetical protein